MRGVNNRVVSVIQIIHSLPTHEKTKQSSHVRGLEQCNLPLWQVGKFSCDVKQVSSDANILPKMHVLVVINLLTPLRGLSI